MTSSPLPPSQTKQQAGKSSTNRLDARRNAYRADLADASLRGKVDAPRFAEGEVRQVIQAVVPMRAAPDLKTSFDTELLFGERVSVFDTRDGWAWVQANSDSYVGYIPAAAITTGVLPSTHKVRALGTFVYPAADIKTPPLMQLSIGSQLSVADIDETFSRLVKGGYVVTRHINEIDRFHRDFVEIAERFIGTPYLWGGRTRNGIDCSGLVQVTLEAAGIAAPRDSDMQRSELGEEIPISKDLEGLERGDLIFWKGHVGIMVDGLMLLHANAHHMAVAIETLPEAAERISKSGSEIVAIRRLPALTI